MPNDHKPKRQRPQTVRQAGRRFWLGVRTALDRVGGWITFLKGAPAIGLLTMLAVAYFQNVSSYEDKVAAQAKDDLAAATAVFAEASNKLSTAMTLQQILYFGYSDAIKDHAEDD
jgi:hypothetical protein